MAVSGEDARRSALACRAGVIETAGARRAGAIRHPARAERAIFGEGGR